LDDIGPFSAGLDMDGDRLDRLKGEITISPVGFANHFLKEVVPHG
jgi:hypothetical protein